MKDEFDPRLGKKGIRLRDGKKQAGFRLAEWAIQPELNRIVGPESEERLNPKTMEVLLLLARHGGEVLAKEQILDEVWQGAFVTDDVLTSAIYELRRALGDEAKSPRFIQTIPKKGYRLIASIESGEEGLPSEKVPFRPRPWMIGGAVALSVVFLALILLSTLWKFQVFAPIPSTKSVPLTSYLGLERSPTFSPDGDRVAFSWDGEEPGAFSIYVQQVGVGGPVRLTDDPSSDHFPAWSPDGRYIAFLRETGRNNYEVRLIPSLGGGAEIKIADVGFLGRMGWSPDSRWLVLSDTPLDQSRPSIYRLSVVDGSVKRLTSAPASSGDVEPAISPDGRFLIFSRQVATFLSHLFLVELSPDLLPRGEPRQLTFEDVMCFDPVWTPDGNEIVFSFGSISDRKLMRMSATGGKPQRLFYGGDSGWYPTISQRGNRLAYAKVVSDADIWRAAIPEKESDLPQVERFIFSTRWDVGPACSPDGEKIAFASERTGSQEIWRCFSDGTHPTRLTFFNGPACAAPAWSPDGKEICFVARPAGNSDIYVVSSEGGAPRRLTDDSAQDVRPSWSRDGKWIYFQSNRGGERQAWKIPVNGGDPILVMADSVNYLLESPDGTDYYYSGYNSQQTGIWKFNKEEGKKEVVFPRSGPGLMLDVSEKGICLVSQPEGAVSPQLEFLDFSDGTRRLVAPLNDPVGKISLSFDSRWVFFSQRGVGFSDLVLVEKFH